MDLQALVDAFVEGSADGLWVLDLDGRTRYANATMARMFSGDADGPPPETAFDILDADGRAQFAELLANTRRGTHRGGESQETLFHDRQGQQCWVLVSDTLLHDDDGAVAGLVVRLTDFAESRRARDALDRNRAALEEARAVGKVGSWRLDVATGVVSVPVSVGEIADSDEVARTTLPEFLAGVHPHDREHAAAVIRDAVAEGDGFEFDVRVPRPEGWAWIRGRGTVHRDADGTATSVSGTHQDVSEIKATERALQIEMQRAELVGLAAASANEAGSFAEALAATRDLAARHMLAERVSGWTATDDGLVLVVGEAGPDHAALAERAHTGRATVWRDDDLVVAVPAVRLGTSYGVLVFESGEPLDHGATGASAATISAQLGLVAARERTLRELVEARDAATAAAKEKTEFLATMSHEIRTPLNGIIGLTDLLLRTALDADQLRFSTGVQVASRDLLRVVTDVLDFSTIQAGQLHVDDVVFEPREVLDVVSELTAPQAAEAGVDLVVSCAPDVPTRLTGDPARITQVLVNLASNAVRFGPGGEVFVHLRHDDDPGCCPAPQDRVCLQVDVRDTGVGIDPGRVGEMFAPFTQADASHSRYHGGTGLGLAIAREIAHALGGDLRHAPTPGGGSTFTLHVSFPAPPSATGAVDEYARAWLAGRRVLVIDARPHHRTRLVEGTTWWGMRTEAVTTAAQARDVIRAAAGEGDPVEALVVDLDTDVGAGLALASEQTAPGDGPVVLALTSDPSVDIAQVRAAGVSVCLAQPVTGAVLRGTLLEQLAGVPARPLEAQPEQRSARRRRILVVEDNPVNQLVATGLLTSLGYDAEVVDDGAAGLAALAETAFDAVLMDVQMPGLDGYATTRALRERGLRLPVVALTAASVEGERQRCLDAGMDDFLTKPVDARALGETLRRWLGEDEDVPDDDPEPAHPATGPIDGLDTERLDMLRDLDPGDTTYLDRAIGNFERNSVEAMATMRVLTADGDAAGLKAAAHKIAGSALNLGVVNGGALARELEITAETSGVEAALPLLDRVEDAFAEGRRLLASYQATYAG